ncbi:Myopalladin, partial [Camelus dromedarius]
IKKKTTKVSLTISSPINETSNIRSSYSTLVQPLCIDPQRVDAESLQQPVRIHLHCSPCIYQDYALPDLKIHQILLTGIRCSSEEVNEQSHVYFLLGFFHSVNSAFVLQHLQDISTTRGQFVVFECRVQATATVQVHWYREKEQIADSDDFRILRKSTVIRFSIYFSLRVTPKSNS